MSDETTTPAGAIKAAVLYFLLILVGSLLAAAVGGGFGALIGWVSPGFVTGLFSLKPVDGSVAGYAASVGMIWGVFLGAGVSCFACLLSAVLRILRLRIEHRSGGSAA